MKRINIGKIVMSIAIIIWLVNTSYHGWNDKAINYTEEYWDKQSRNMLIIGLMIYFSAIFRFIEKKIKDNELS